MTSPQFSQLSLHPGILRALTEQKYEHPTPIQEAAIPEVLQGNDLLATAQTGTGKTAAFALPILHMLTEHTPSQAGAIRVLVLTPTRELALQIDESFRTYGRYLKLRTAVVLGGVSQVSQVKALGKKPDILVATPGRLIDLVGQGHIRLNGIETLVLDEADRMLDMGFINDIRKIVAKIPSPRQTLLFSATIPPEVHRFAANMLNNPVSVVVTPSASISGNIEQRVLFVDQGNKPSLLTNILKDKKVQRALVFARTKHRADRLVRQLSNEGIPSDAIHSNKSQNARQRALSAFDKGRIKVLVGTDIVSRGIDVDGISHVINYELPENPENYVHRIGRTARAGSTGIALSFCTPREIESLHGIEKLTKCKLATDEEHPYHSSLAAALHDRISKPAPASAPQPRFNRKPHQRSRVGRRR